ncbi:MAG: hypothetical protein HC888_12735, partial [Candidatus Competibacteraceae bacterium]|nr:hypothetical protein [Candidatus Competibacteraceae bacterium]
MSDEIVVVIDGEDGEEAVQAMGILSEEQRIEIMKGLKEEYDTAVTEMDARNQKVVKWRRNMEAIASDAPKNHPFKNSSNVVVPVTQMVTQTLVSKVKGMFDAREPLWKIDGHGKEEEKVRMRKVIESYLNMLASGPYDLDMKSAIDDLANEVVLTGGAFPKVGYEIQRWRVKSSDGSEGQEVVAHDGPLVTVLPVESVRYRRGIGNIQRLPWIAVDMQLTEVELRAR